MTKDARLCWLDLEMTGLNTDVDKILEVAALVADFDNKIIFDGLEAVVHYAPEDYTITDPWVQNQHEKSGLLQAVADSKTDLATVENIFYEALKPYCNKDNTFLAGNSIHQDRAFIKKYMPKLDSLFHYRLVDVSTIKVLVREWYPGNPNTEFKKSKDHRALIDIQESMAELANFRKYFFKN